MSDASETDVLVLGAGPVGLLAALELSRRGVRVEIVDQHRRTALHSYALVLHGEVLQLLDELGLASSLIDRGQSIDSLAVHHGRSLVAEIDLTRPGGPDPPLLVIPQFLLEAALEQGLVDRGVSVGWGKQVLTFDADRDGVTTLVATGLDSHGPSETGDAFEARLNRIRSAFLVGADGSQSLARRLLDIEWLDQGPLLVYGLVEFGGALDAPGRADLVLQGQAAHVLWPLGPDRGRFGLQLEEPPAAEDAAMLVQLAREVGAWSPASVSVDWFTTVAFRPRLAEHFGRERVWLAGDAAHGTSPLGAQSMNVGLREAADLARRLALILCEGKSAKLLRYYEEERQREWKMLLGMRDRLRVEPHAPRWAREVGGRLVPLLPASGRDLNLLLEQVGLRLDVERHRRPDARPD